MNTLEQIRSQSAALWQSLAPSQRLTIGVVLALLLGGFGVLLLRDGVDRRVPLFTGKAFTVEESMNAQQILLAAGLDGFEQKGAQLYVPADEVERYNAALVAGGGLPTNWAEEWEKQNAALGQFTGSLEREATKEMARGKQVARLLTQIPDIAWADVVWDEDARPGWRTAPKARATVSLRPVPGRSITPKLVRAARLATAGSKKHLAPEDVVVIDVLTGSSYDGQEDGEFGDKLLSRVNHFESMYRNRILETLDYIKGVRVAVNVTLDNIERSRRRSQKINPKESLAVAEETVRNTESSQKTASIAEPGAGPNAALDLQSGRGPSQTTSVSENVGSILQTASFEVTEEQIAGLMPQAVTVAVSVPKGYYRGVAMESPGLKGREDLTEDEIEAVTQQMEAEYSQRIQRQIQMMLPPADPTATPDDIVKVDSFVPLADETVLESLPLTWTMADMARSWGRPLALLALSAVALLMVNSSLKRPLPELPPPPPAAVAGGSPDDPESEAAELEDDLPLLRPPDNRKREHLQEVVRDNPELTASVVASWVAERV